MTEEVAEEITVQAPASDIFAAVGDVKRMAHWSPECFAVWVWRRKDSRPDRFIGWNRRAAFIWFTTCRVAVDEPDNEFAFDVTTFGQPVSRWGYRITPGPDGAVLTEYWQDQRNKTAFVLGKIFTGSVAKRRPQANREGMRETLARIKQDLEHV